MTLWQFFGCVTCYYIGLLLLSNKSMVHCLLVGILVAFTFCLVRAVDQRLFEFPQSHQTLVEGERTGWTNFTPEAISVMKRENIIVTTNGVDVVNPAILAKFAKGRVNGTLVYPNAMAGAILLLYPVSIVLALKSSRKLRPIIRGAVIIMVLFLGMAGLFWTGSKLGWLVALAVSIMYVFRLNFSARLKWFAIIFVLLVGLGVFVGRFHSYLATGATSVSARFDYWRAAVLIAIEHPVLGTGPGTFQRPYEQIKSPESEMARLTHNDYLEQFSDSGILGGCIYALWIVLALIIVGQRTWRSEDPIIFGIFAGLLGWFMQGIGEFSLYIPALAWTAFTLLGCLLSCSEGGNHIDKSLKAT
jgi:O-antigen ligase